jgi:hypothetical protein
MNKYVSPKVANKSSELENIDSYVNVFRVNTPTVEELINSALIGLSALIFALFRQFNTREQVYI